jgi:nicotinamide-nucleotide amidase
MFPDDLLKQAADLLIACRQHGFKVATAESCTGGLVAGCLTAIAGSSDVVDRGFVTYTNEAKTELIGVPGDLIAAHGAVSEPVARAMSAGALAHSRADMAVAITGIAGPGGGTPTKPVGLVHFAAARRDGTIVHARHVLPGDRTQVRLASVRIALDLLARLAQM